MTKIKIFEPFKRTYWDCGLLTKHMLGMWDFLIQSLSTQIKSNNFHTEIMQKKLPRVVAIITRLISSLWEEGHLDSFIDFAPWCSFQDQAVTTTAWSTTHSCVVNRSNRDSVEEDRAFGAGCHRTGSVEEDRAVGAVCHRAGPFVPFPLAVRNCYGNHVLEHGNYG